MPELPEVEALADYLRQHAVGKTVGRVDVSALSVLKTFDPPINALHGLPAEVVGQRLDLGQFGHGSSVPVSGARGA